MQSPIQVPKDKEEELISKLVEQILINKKQNMNYPSCYDEYYESDEDLEC